ncbi:MAG: HpcH/HpaI aldolase/citrate lyase family protein, partial [Nakamurella sp.]
ADHIRELTEALGSSLSVVSGFVLPKFSVEGGTDYLKAVAAAAQRSVHPLYAMPVLETPKVLYRESREAELVGIRELLDEHRQLVLTVRIGATDLCGLFGIRRDRDLSIYDVGVAADLITQVVNHLGRSDGTGFAITGPVWEYFANHERILRPQLRQTPYDDRQAGGLRRQLMSSDLDGLMRETMLDRANGLTGKSVIHPLHIPPVHALAVVPHEEYLDALSVLDPESASGGVKNSEYRNKMNEMRPHRIWAERTALRARVFGVAAPGISHIDIMNEQ